MYLLYEKEVDEAMRTEQERLLYWISQASKLNPDASLPAILNAADDYLKNTTFKIYKERQSLFDKNEVMREAQEKTAALEAHTANLKKISDEEAAAAEAAAEVEAALLAAEAEAEAVLLAEAEANKAEDDAFEEELVETVDEVELVEEVVEEEPVEEEEVAEVSTLDDYSEPVLDVEVKEEELAEEEEVKLPERDDAADKIKQNRQKTVRANYDAIYSNKSDIAEL